MTTKCVEVCPNKVRTFGNLNDPDSAVSKIITSERNFRLNMKWFKPVPLDMNIRGLKS
jgi:Fe-S-cluster-containing dehydrogenase component